MGVRGLLVLFGLIVVCVLLTLLIDHSDLPVYIASPLAIALCLVIGFGGDKYVK